MKFVNLKNFVFLLAIASVPGCSSSPETATPERPENVTYQKPGVYFSKYRNVMFGALEISVPQDGAQPNVADLRRLRSAFRDAIYGALQNSTTGLQNRYVDRHGRDVLLVKPRLTGTRTVSGDSSPLRTDSATSTLQIDGSLTLEISLHNSLDGELLLTAEDTQSRSRSADSANVDWAEVSVITHEWAKSVIEFLDSHLDD